MKKLLTITLTILFLIWFITSMILPFNKLFFENEKINTIHMYSFIIFVPMYIGSYILNKEKSGKKFSFFRKVIKKESVVKEDCGCKKK